MKTRVLSGLAMVPLAALVYFGGKLFWFGVFWLAIIGIKEFYDAFQNGTAKTEYPIRPRYVIGIGAVGCLYIWSITMQPVALKDITGLIVLVVFVFLLSMFRAGDMDLERFLEKYFGALSAWQSVGMPASRVNRTNVLVTLLGFCYIGLFFCHLIFIDRLPDSYRILIWLVFITAFGTDIMAYFTGYFLGKHKLCPTISPKKTIEGSVGGILGSALLCGLFGWIVMSGILIHCIVIGFVGSIVAQLGDLTASIFKRKLGIKDYGNLIPGHGGILDRFDSVLFTAPLVYYYIVLIIR